MESEQKKQIILKMLSKNEETLAKLYQTYAQRFPRYGDFWLELAKEEMQHASIIENIPTKSGQLVGIREDRFDTEVLKISLDYIEEKLAQARNEKISHKEAMTTALDIETGMLERGYFEVFQGDSSEFRQTLKLLAAETHKHTDKIRQGLAKKRWKIF